MLTTEYMMNDNGLLSRIDALNENRDIVVTVKPSINGDWFVQIHNSKENMTPGQKTFDTSGAAIEAFSFIVSMLNTIAIQEKAVKAAEAVLLEKKAMLDRDSAELEQFLKGE